MYYRIREPIGTVMQLKHFVEFSTVEEAISTDIPASNTMAYILEFQEPPKENQVYKFSDHIRARWEADLGWVKMGAE